MRASVATDKDSRQVELRINLYDLVEKMNGYDRLAFLLEMSCDAVALSVLAHQIASPHEDLDKVPKAYVDHMRPWDKVEERPDIVFSDDDRNRMREILRPLMEGAANELIAAMREKIDKYEQFVKKFNDLQWKKRELSNTRHCPRDQKDLEWRASVQREIDEFFKDRY
jgi:hypothetical protein